MNKIWILTLPLLMTACLQTRTAQKEQEEKQMVRKTLTNLQQTTADVNSRFQDLEDDSRKHNGRIESLEAKLQQASARMEQASRDSGQRDKANADAYKEEFSNLRNEIKALKEQVAGLQAEQSRAAQSRAEAESNARAAAETRASEAAKGPFASAESKFEKKNWQGAVLDYEKYRSSNPKGKQYSTATYKIGVCFQELGDRDSARAFYEEVISKYPKSKDADKASTRLKALNKK